MMQFAMLLLLTVFSTFVWLHPRNQISTMQTDIHQDNNIFATLRLCERNKKYLAKTLRRKEKEGAGDSWISSNKQYPEYPVHPV